MSSLDSILDNRADLPMDPSDRYSTTSPDFAKRLHEVLTPHLSPFPHPARGGAPRLPHSMNSSIRMYKYTQGQYFGLAFAFLGYLAAVADTQIASTTTTR